MLDLDLRFGHEDTPERREFLDQYGFVIIEDGLDPLDLADFRSELINVIQAHLTKARLSVPRERSLTDGLLALEGADHEYVGSVYDTIFQSPAFFRLVGSLPIEQTVKALMGLDDQHALYGFTNRCLVAPPADERRTYGWHQEVFYTIPRSRFLQTWAPLIIDAHAQNGSIQILPGFHKEGIARQVWNDVPGRATQILIADDVVDKYTPMTINMKVGELMIFSGYLAHRSGHNISNDVRYSLVGMYHDVSCEGFLAPKPGFEFRGIQPREWYNAQVAKHV